MKKCMGCATENADHAKFCKKCGTMFISNYTNSDIVVDKKNKSSKINPLISSVIWLFIAILSVAGMFLIFKFYLLPQLEVFLKQLIQLEFKMQYIYEGTSLNYVFSALRTVFTYGAFSGLFAALGITFIFSLFGIFAGLRKFSAQKRTSGKKPVILFKVYSVCFKIYAVIVLLIALISGLMALLSIIL
ncbi:MAG: hypothetical protein IJC74_05395 [Clostridia bacterium]|nr:hypothetical protein [Clostridia bacterium]